MADNNQQLPDSPFTAATQQEGGLPDSPFTSSVQADPNKSQGPLSGKYADWYFSQVPSAVSDAATIMSHIGQGAEDGWGSGSGTISKTLDQALTKAGLYNDHSKNQNDYFKSINEALVRPVVNTLAALGSGTLGAVVGGFQGTGAALQTHAKDVQEHTFNQYNPVSSALGEAGEIFGSTPERVPDLHVPELTAQARSKAVIGEGEQGFFNTKPISDENLEARQSAANNAGDAPETVSPPEPPQMDIHQVVRQMDPALFDEVDRLNDIKNNYQDNISYAKSQDIADVQRDIDIHMARTMEDNPGATAIAQGHLDNLNAQIEALKAGEYGPKAQETQATYMENLNKLYDLQSDVASVYQHAQEIMMSPEEIAENPELANPRLQELTDKISTDGLTKQEWNEYNVLSKAQEEKTVDKEPTVGGEQEATPPKIIAQSASSTKGDKTQGYGLLKPLSKEAGAQKVPGVSKDIEAAAVEKGLTKEFINEDHPTFTSTTVKYQSERISKLMNDDPEGAKQMAFGEKEIPGDVVHSMLFSAVRDQADKEGDIETSMKLTKSPLAVQSSLHSQALGMSGKFNKLSPTNIIKNITDARRSTKKLSKGIIDDRAKLTEAKKKVFTKQAVKDFLKDIQCEE